MLISSIHKFKKELILVSSLIILLIVNTLGINASSQITVHPGDNLKSLAQKYHVSVTALTRRNHLHHQVTLVTNQKLVLPNSTDTGSRAQSANSNEDQNTQDSRSSMSKLSAKEQTAKDWIAYHESRGEYHVNNGQYYGKFELDIRLLKGNYSHANQERTADRYVHQRYGSWLNAKHFWETHNWY